MADNENPSELALGPAPVQEENPVSPALPENPASAHGDGLENKGGGGNLQRIVSAAAGVFDRAGIPFRKGKGRPRNDGLPGKADIPLAVPGAGAVAPVAAVASSDTSVAGPALDSGLVRRCVAQVAKTVNLFLGKMFVRKAVAAGLAKRDADSIVAECAATDSEVDDLAVLAEICLKKYGVGTEYCPEIGAGAILLGMGLRWAAAFKTLDAAAGKGGAS